MEQVWKKEMIPPADFCVIIGHAAGVATYEVKVRK